MPQNLKSEFRLEVEQAIQRFDQDNAVAIPLHLAEQDKAALMRFRIESTPLQFASYGDPIEILQHHLTTHLLPVGRNNYTDVADIARLIARLSFDVQQGLSFEAAETLVRLFRPTNDYDISRWHRDGQYFPSRRIYKVVATLKGARTLFGNLTNWKQFDAITREDETLWQNLKNDPVRYGRKSLKLRRELAKVVERRSIGRHGDAVLYLAGDEGASAVHSEPPIHEPRIFMSVLPGSRGEIHARRLRQRK